MKDRIVIWGQDEKDEDILIAIRLLQDSDIIKIWTFPKKDTKTEFVDKLFREWKEGAEDNFPMPFNLIERGIGEENMLPEGIKTPKTDVIKIAEQEWRVKVLSFRLYQHIKQQIEQLDTRTENLSIFSKDVWEEAKDVSKSIKENTLDRNIKKRQTTELRKSLDLVFDKLKKLQNSEQEKFLGVSKGFLGDYRQKIKAVMEEIGKGGGGKKYFDQLVKYQHEVKGLDMTIRDRNALRLNFNEAFDALKANRQSHMGNRMNARVKGLKGAIGKMEASIKRDKDNVNYQSGRINKNNTTQLEYQLRSAKLKLIEDTIQSKEAKLHDMYLTLKDLEKKASKMAPKAQKVVLPKDKKADSKKGDAEKAEKAPAANADANQVESTGKENKEKPIAAETKEATDVKSSPATAAPNNETPKSEESNVAAQKAAAKEEIKVETTAAPVTENVETSKGEEISKAENVTNAAEEGESSSSNLTGLAAKAAGAVGLTGLASGTVKAAGGEGENVAEDKVPETGKIEEAKSEEPAATENSNESKVENAADIKDNVESIVENTTNVAEEGATGSPDISGLAAKAAGAAGLTALASGIVKAAGGEGENVAEDKAQETGKTEEAKSEKVEAAGNSDETKVENAADIKDNAESIIENTTNAAGESISDSTNISGLAAKAAGAVGLTGLASGIAKAAGDENVIEDNAQESETKEESKAEEPAATGNSDEAKVENSTDLKEKAESITENITSALKEGSTDIAGLAAKAAGAVGLTGLASGIAKAAGTEDATEAETKDKETIENDNAEEIKSAAEADGSAFAADNNKTEDIIVGEEE